MHCICCGRAITEISKHHLIPRSRHHNKKVKRDFARTKLQQTISICRACHEQIHTIFSEKELGRHYNQIDNMLSHPAMVKFAAWIKNKPLNFKLKVKR